MKKRIDEIMILVPKRIRKPSTKAKTGDIELDEKIVEYKKVKTSLEDIFIRLTNEKTS
jgi:hypothetical protein